MRCPRYATRFTSRSHRKYALFSVHGNERSHKSGLVDIVHKTSSDLRLGKLKPQDALIVLASRQYASWLLDNKFMAALVDSFKGKYNPHSEINVLAAAVDGLHPRSAMGDTPRGFSFFYGPMNRMMPNLWQDDGQPKPLGESKLQAAITFQFQQEFASIHCTLPLANTIFENGLQSTFLASRWHQKTNNALPELLQIKKKQSQDVTFWSGTKGSDFYVESPIFPITVPRKILAGLGNIVRQIEVEGQETPASAELEKAVHELYDRRTNEGHEFPPGPVGVWAIVVPPGRFQDTDLKLLQQWTGDPEKSQIRSVYDEWADTLVFKDLVHRVLQHGGRVYKILSGGGGWGKKQGLLSLDPEVSYSASSEEKDLESFIRSFENRHEGGDQQDVVSPGSYIQYFASPLMSARPNPPRPHGATLAFALGASGSATSEEPLSTNDCSEWKVIPEHFGAVSNHGLFVKNETSEGFISESKIDVPGSWVGSLKLSNP
ncbi:hypothetical protein LY78DRAFT_687807 [Colletotrichum sublineola]|nr:hypothetical protein LY78DRAFT_687807 [Colletotrichum sublineola]